MSPGRLRGVGAPGRPGRGADRRRGDTRPDAPPGRGKVPGLRPGAAHQDGEGPERPVRVHDAPAEGPQGRIAEQVGLRDRPPAFLLGTPVFGQECLPGGEPPRNLELGSRDPGPEQPAAAHLDREPEPRGQPVQQPRLDQGRQPLPAGRAQRGIAGDLGAGQPLRVASLSGDSPVGRHRLQRGLEPAQGPPGPGNLASQGPTSAGSAVQAAGEARVAAPRRLYSARHARRRACCVRSRISALSIPAARSCR